MESPYVTYEDLCRQSGYSEPAEVVTWLVENEIPYFLGKFRHPTTTAKALNQALGLENKKELNRRIVA